MKWPAIKYHTIASLFKTNDAVADEPFPETEKNNTASTPKKPGESLSPNRKD
jgi:hypothetical protein